MIKDIFRSRFYLVGLSFLFLALKGFDKEEFTALFLLQGFITAIYGYISCQKNVHPRYTWVPFFEVILFFVVLVLISIKAFAPNWLNFLEMIIAVAILEVGSLVATFFLFETTWPGSRPNKKT